MANKYWVGNGGNINDTAHWSLTSGGAGGASFPTSADRALFDANSFTLTGQTVTVNVAFDCLDMDWTGATNNPTLGGASLLSIGGSLTLISSMLVTYSNTITFFASTTGKTITTAGVLLDCSINFNGVGGGWILQDDLDVTKAGPSTTKIISVIQGTFDSNNKNIKTGTFNSSNSNVRTVKLGSSQIECKRSGSSGWVFTNTTNLTFTANTAVITLSGTTASFNGGGLTYTSIIFTGSTTTINDSNTITTLTYTAGKTIKLTSGTTQTVTNLICNGTTASPITLQSVTAGSPATIVLPAGRYFIRHTSIKDITITGATSVTSIAGTNVSGNAGITFVAKFEMGRIKNDGSLNWYNSTTGTVTKVSG